MFAVKGKPTNKSLKEKREIIEKGKTNMEASQKFGVPKNTFLCTPINFIV